MSQRKCKIFCADFETSVYSGQTNTEVWSAACVEFGTEDVKIFTSINDQYNFFANQYTNLIVYYHNLKFDGSFWLNFLLNHEKLKPAYITDESGHPTGFLENKKMPSGTFKYLISTLGQWYTITIKTHNRIIEIRDSLKLLPFELRQIGIDFETKHQKLTMEYVGERHAGGTITPEEREYIKNDVLVLKEAIEKMYARNWDRLTIGSVCLHEYRNLLGKQLCRQWFPDLGSMTPNGKKITDEQKQNGIMTADEFVRKAYHGGWCYLNPKKSEQIIKNGITLDVNSLYPSVMSGESGNKYPVGKPYYFTGDILKSLKSDDIYYFVHFTCRFKIKRGKLPFVQIRDKYIYTPNEHLTTSDFYDPIKKRYCRYYRRDIDDDDTIIDTVCEMTMTETDFRLFRDHYNIYDLQIIDGVYFRAEVGIFDKYINIYRDLKINAKNKTERTLAKLALNNLYGKMATSDNSSFKIAYIHPSENRLSFYTVVEHNKKTGYIAVGAAITSYARDFTIRAAQKNYKHFIYADTDSIHCDCDFDDIRGIKKHQSKFLCWKQECNWDNAIFLRQKSYIEHVTHENEQKIENPYYSVKCAGMPKGCIKTFAQELQNGTRKLTDFKDGLKIAHALKSKQIAGGALLYESDWILRLPPNNKHAIGVEKHPE